MQSAFRILTHLNSSYLHLKLVGDFDQNAANLLIDLLRTYCRKVSTIIIHTDCLKHLVPFDLNDFRQEFDRLKTGTVRFIFTGEHASFLN